MKKVLLGAICAMGLASCSVVGTGAGSGVAYTSVTEGAAVTSNSLGTKVGTGKEIGILGLIVTGDASIQTAAKNAGIKKISHIDAKKSSVLGIFSTYEIIVYGE